MKIAQKSDETPYVHVNHTTFIVHHLQTLHTWEGNKNLFHCIFW